MSEDDKKKITSPPQPPKYGDDALRVKTLYFKGSVDLPTEQQQARMSTIERTGRPRYEITLLPRIGMYHVRAFDPRPSDIAVDSPKPTHTFLIPLDWAVAELEIP